MWSNNVVNAAACNVSFTRLTWYPSSPLIHIYRRLNSCVISVQLLDTFISIFRMYRSIILYLIYRSFCLQGYIILSLWSMLICKYLCVLFYFVIHYEACTVVAGELSHIGIEVA